MSTTRQDVVHKLMDYLNHRVTLSGLVDWAEQAMMEGELIGEDCETVREVVARIGLADVRAFGLTWEEFLKWPGYRAQVVVSEVST